MVVLTEMSVMMVGMERQEEFDGMPIRLLNREYGKEAIRSFKQEHIDSVVCRWDLPDMRDGLFLKRLKAAMPQVPVVAIVQPDSPQQEIQARQMGAAAVITEDCDGDYFRQVLASVFGLHEVKKVKALH